VEVLRRIKADDRTKSIPVVVLTSSRDARDLIECRRLGAKTYIVKPLDFQGLSRVTSPLNLDWLLLQRPPEKPRSRRQETAA
jgi:CheY-like chemotaxis protein